MKRSQLRKDEVRALSAEIESRYSTLLAPSKKDRVEVVDGTIVEIKGEPCFFYMQDRKVAPLLKPAIAGKMDKMKSIRVDMNSIRFIASGADIMRPGITHLEQDIQQGELVLVLDSTHSKAIAVGKALASGEEIKAMEKGKAFLNIHHVGDRIWSGS